MTGEGEGEGEGDGVAKQSLNSGGGGSYSSPTGRKRYVILSHMLLRYFVVNLFQLGPIYNL